MSLYTTYPRFQKHGLANKHSLDAIRSRASELSASIIPALESALQNAHRERDLLQNQLDAYQYPVVDKLPPEITSEIFVNFLPPYPACPPASGLFSPWIFCQICRRWRDIALTTPSLWRGIELHLDDKEQFHKSQLHWLETRLSLSKQCSLSIDLRYTTPVDPNKFHPSMKPFVDAVIRHCARWEEVVMRVPLRDCDLLDGDMPMLRSLQFGASDTLLQASPGVAIFPPSTIFTSAPQFRTLYLDSYFSPSDFVLPWAQLTTIIVNDGLYDNECADILRYSVNLEHCILTVVDAPAEVIDLAISPLLHLKRLLFYDFIATPSSRAKELLGSLVLPSLTTLELSADWFVPDPGASIAALVLRSGCKL
ncbi:hypothetical protein DFH08DRAFT_1017115 [Mycena albidolilacea]|uniref:F-box domain-containing protein n=1 Tax=Mycena albidolilacea TaxID=1033008 RepID=A0AAD7APH0_9AGAR|nr:hypothetical protein DFH08DRAFT_1017115 [Mycena albidolilacea]